MLRQLFAATFAALLVLSAATELEAQTTFPSNAEDSAESAPKKRSGETIILGKNDVIRIEDMSPIRYRMTLSRHSRRFDRDADTVVYFAANSATLTTQAQAALDDQAAWIRANPRARIAVTGYSDRKSDPASNERLGLERARAVATHLVKAGVDRDRLMAIQGARFNNKFARSEAKSAKQRRAATRIVELIDPDWSEETRLVAGSSPRIVTSAESSGSTGGSSGSTSGGGEKDK